MVGAFRLWFGPLRLGFVIFFLRSEDNVYGVDRVRILYGVGSLEFFVVWIVFFRLDSL